MLLHGLGVAVLRICGVGVALIGLWCGVAGTPLIGVPSRHAPWGLEAHLRCA